MFPMKNIHLLIIDPQNDFCDLPDKYLPFDSNGNQTLPQLPVPGAHADMQRLAAFIRANTTYIQGMTITLDSHHAYGIERPSFWLTSEGQTISPFTQVTAADVKAGTYLPRHTEHIAHSIDYLEQLESAGRYTHMVWPAHCEIGTWGHNIHADVRHACSEWEVARGRAVNQVFKGINPLVEHYSAIRAEVIDPNDPSTDINHKLLNSWDEVDILLIAGEAGSHCVKSTVEHIIEYRTSLRPIQIVLLTDCMSPVSGFNATYQAFLGKMLMAGVLTTTSTSYRF
jgi:nicotinamidase/pyrazinamidase